MINEKLKKIKLVITDVDGVLTDGLLHYDANGEAIKSSMYAMDLVSKC